MGGGGREHALAWKIRQSALCKNLFVAPGNAGTAELGKNISIDILDFDKVKEVIKDHSIEMLIVGPEAPLVQGIADYMHQHLPYLKVVGPSKKAAQLEGSKAYAKQFMKDNGIPTASYFEVTKANLKEGVAHLRNSDPPFVLKADGLAAGKGVLIIDDIDEAVEELTEMIEGKFGAASHRVVIEEFLDGIEFSAFIITDGQYYTLLPMAKDYKRIGEGDTGLNTGGMGAISPVPFVDAELLNKVRDRIILPTLNGLQKRNIDYVGFIFFGLINIKGDPYVIEYNCRMGDPESEVVIPRLKNDIVEILDALFDRDLYEIPIDLEERYAATVMLVSGGYPTKYTKGYAITGTENINESILFHAGTKRLNNTVQTNGGRVLAITSLAENLNEAVKKSTEIAQQIQFEGKYFRSDIGFDL